MNHNLVVARETIQHGDPLKTHYALQDMVHFGKRVMILKGNYIQVSKVNENSYFPFIFSNRNQILHPT